MRGNPPHIAPFSPAKQSAVLACGRASKLRCTVSSALGPCRCRACYSRAVSNAARIREFHRAIGLNPPAQPTVPDTALLGLRRTLLAEEWPEVSEELGRLEARIAAQEALNPADLAPLAHELTDLLYVTYGALDLLGVDADAIFAEVHRANLSKASGPKRADGKQLKPGGWRPADVLGVMLQGAKE